MNNVGGNLFEDANSLVHGCFPQMEELWVSDERDFDDDFQGGSNDRCFPAKMQAASLE